MVITETADCFIENWLICHHCLNALVTQPGLTIDLHTKHVVIRLAVLSDCSLNAAGNVLRVVQEANGWISLDLTTTSHWLIYGDVPFAEVTLQ